MEDPSSASPKDSGVLTSSGSPCSTRSVICSVTPRGRLSSRSTCGSEAESDEEREANEYAAEVLFPKGTRLRIAGAETKPELMLLAADLNLGVAIVAGQHGHLTGDWRTGGSLRSSSTEHDLVKLEALSASPAA